MATSAKKTDGRKSVHHEAVKPARKKAAKGKPARTRSAKPRAASKQRPTKRPDKKSSAKAATSARSTSAAGRYSKPALREAVKKQVKAGSRGGKPGQWSARKAQRVATEYKKRGGGYLGGPRTATQKRIQKWDHA